MYSRLFSSLLFTTLLAIGSPFSTVEGPQGNDNPKVIETKVPVYPMIALAARASGTVVVDVQIDSDGKVSSAKVNQGHPLLSGASRNAAIHWRFESDAKGEGNRRVSLMFDFVLPSVPGKCAGGSTTISAYHLQIESPIIQQPPDTISYVPPDSKEKHCPVHGSLLLRDRVEIAYGLIGLKPGYAEAEKRLFPEANLEVLGGCVVETQINCDGTQLQTSPKYAEVLYCPACRRAQARWLKTHP